jgi:hypothetical protein
MMALLGLLLLKVLPLSAMAGNLGEELKDLGEQCRAPLTKKWEESAIFQQKVAFSSPAFFV